MQCQTAANLLRGLPQAGGLSVPPSPPGTPQDSRCPNPCFIDVEPVGSGRQLKSLA